MTAHARPQLPQSQPAPLGSDIVIIGGGFAGALAALTLGRQGRSVIVIDTHHPYPPDFRAEKLSTAQVAGLNALGVGNIFAENLGNIGMRYDEMVNTLRGQWPETVRFVQGRAQGIKTGATRQQVVVHGGTLVEARLIIVATGPGGRLRASLGLQKYTLSARHSLCIGLTLATGDPRGFSGPLIEPGAVPGDGIAYASLFPLAGHPGLMRVNLFLYDHPHSARARRFRDQPVEALFAALPRLKSRLPAVTRHGPVEARVTDLYDVTPPRLPGIVLIGDARRTSCPAAGGGLTRILGDVRDLARTFVPQWLAEDAPALDIRVTHAFYNDDARRALDADLHRRSLNARRMALETGLYWRLRRGAYRLAAWLYSREQQPLKPLPAMPTRFFTGDLVTVRRASEILATLDNEGKLEGMPFMPEMTVHIGRRMRVHRRAGRTCVEGHGLRGLTDAVFLETARCDGARHDGCQRDCLMFWKEAWLRPAGSPPPRANDIREQAALNALRALATRRGRRYICQSTELGSATRRLSKMHLGAMLKEVLEDEMPVREFLRLAVRALINRLRAGIGLAELGMVRGAPGEKSRGDLNLKPGDWVRIKDIEAIRETVGPHGRNRGLSFEPEMTRHAGQVRQVDKVIERIIHEETGDMVRLGQTVTLKNLYCQGHCAKACPRANPLFWREAWLERVEGPEDVS